MTIGFTSNGVALDPDRVRLAGDPNNAEAAFTSSAIAGGYDTASVIVEDMDGTLDFATMQSFLVTDDDCAVTRIWTGYIVSVVLEKGPAYQPGIARIWNLELAGINSYPMLRIFDPAVDSPKRPAENSMQRLDWLLGTTAVIGGSELFNDAFVDTSSPINLDEADYDGQRPADVLNDLIGVFVPYNWFIVYNPADDTQGLFYGAVDDGISTSTIDFTNVLGDVDSTTLLIHDDATFTRDGQDIAAAVHVKWRGGSFLRRRTSTAVIYTDRHANLSSDRVGRFATASSWAEGYLDLHDEPTEMLEWTADIPATQVNLVREGMVTNITATHFPGFETGGDVVIRRRAVQQYPGRVDLYRVRFQGSVSVVEGGLGGGDPNELPQEPSICLPALRQITSRGTDDPDSSLNYPLFGVDPIPGNLMTAFVVVIGEPGEEANPDGFTGVGAGWEPDPSTTKDLNCRWFYRIVQPGDSATISLTTVGTISEHFSTVHEWEMSDAVLDELDTILDDTDQTNPMTFPVGPVTPPAATPVLVVGSVMPSLNVGDSWLPTNDDTLTTSGFPGGLDEPKSWLGYQVFSDTEGAAIDFTVGNTGSGNSRGYVGLTVAFTGSCEGGGCPATGKPNARPEVVTMTGADGTTLCPFADGTLHVFVDATEQTDGLVSQDGVTGDFTLGFDPTPTEVVTVEYLGR